MFVRSRFIAAVLSAGFLATVLTGASAQHEAVALQGEWRVTAITEAEVPEGVEVSMRVADEGQVSGRGGCNRYSGEYELAGDRLTIGPVAMTRMACPDEQMTTETRFGVAVGDVARAGIDETGALILSDAGGARLIVALPATD